MPPPSSMAEFESKLHPMNRGEFELLEGSALNTAPPSWAALFVKEQSVQEAELPSLYIAPPSLVALLLVKVQAANTA